MSFLQGILSNANGSPPGQMNPQQLAQAQGMFSSIGGQGQQTAPLGSVPAQTSMGQQTQSAPTTGQWGNNFTPTQAPQLAGPATAAPSVTSQTSELPGQRQMATPGMIAALQGGATATTPATHATQPTPVRATTPVTARAPITPTRTTGEPIQYNPAQRQIMGY